MYFSEESVLYMNMTGKNPPVSWQGSIAIVINMTMTRPNTQALLADLQSLRVPNLNLWPDRRCRVDVAEPWEEKFRMDKDGSLEEKWNGPYWVLLTSFTAIKIKEQTPRTHYSRAKKASEPRWTIKSIGDLKLRNGWNDYWIDKTAVEVGTWNLTGLNVKPIALQSGMPVEIHRLDGSRADGKFNHNYYKTLQTEVSSLSKAVLQNRMALDLSTAKEGGVRIIINTSCCAYINKDKQMHSREPDNEGRRRAERKEKVAQVMTAIASEWNWHGAGAEAQAVQGDGVEVPQVTRTTASDWNRHGAGATSDENHSVRLWNRHGAGSVQAAFVIG
ncbi:hypothetical protein QYF61_006367 [Mycteria americana]|uniref:Uncharacterized protein n=1 Tax=Mycteria americana TaxID=33587 RepID=A0AAN7N9P6_MYCAM|nr:hypothetical protein QYF61_006367 [Mycteria americana]